MSDLLSYLKEHPHWVVWKGLYGADATPNKVTFSIDGRKLKARISLGFGNLGCSFSMTNPQVNGYSLSGTYSAELIINENATLSLLDENDNVCDAYAADIDDPTLKCVFRQGDFNPIVMELVIDE